jgi:hypothetical protein
MCSGIAGLGLRFIFRWVETAWDCAATE